MKTIILLIFSLLGGISLALQAGFNSQLGSQLKNSMIAVAATSFFSLIFALGYLILNSRSIPDWSQLNSIPWYLWGIGGLFSVIGISIYLYSIPRIGISTMVALGLSGQLLFAIVAGHFGWFNLPKDPFTVKKAIGSISLLAGILLLNIK